MSPEHLDRIEALAREGGNDLWEALSDDPQTVPELLRLARLALEGATLYDGTPQRRLCEPRYDEWAGRVLRGAP